MKTFPAVMFGVCASLSLTACLEVEDNRNNDDIVEAINNIDSDETETSVTLRGVVKDAQDSSNVAGVTVSIRAGTLELATTTTLDDGTFELSGLPVSSSVDVVISDESGDFLTNVYSMTTNDAQQGTSFQDSGALYISEPVDISLEILTADNAPVTGLEFKGTMLSASSTIESDYIPVSSFDETNGLYTITLPRYITTQISASLDVDSDGTVDYGIEDGSYTDGNYLYVNNANLADIDTIYAYAMSDAVTTVEFRISILDEDFSSLETASVLLDDELNDNLTSTYDADTEQHVITASFNARNYSQIQLMIPNLEVGDSFYESAGIYIYKDGDEYRLDSYNADNNFYYTVEASESINIPIQLREGSIESEVELIARNLDTDTGEYTLYYSHPVTFAENAISLVQSRAISVVRGNDSDEDLVAEGTTVISRQSVAVDVAVEQALDNTRVTITPLTSLLPSTGYEYKIGRLTAEGQNSYGEINGDDWSFDSTASSEEAFSIEDLVLDNNNYLDEGSVITATNTADVAASPSDYHDSVYVFIPVSVSNLQNFILTKKATIEDGTTYINTDTITIVEDGNVNFSLATAVTTAQNESVQNDASNVYRGTSLPDASKWYMAYTYEYMQDNTSSRENQIVFEYALETKDGEIETGEITLPVH